MIVVFGSINLDLVARVATLPAAGETLAATAFASRPGGKGANQALAARRAGAEVALFGAVGNDAFADAALALIRGSGIDITGVIEVAAATGIALIHVDDAGENAITLVAGANAQASSEAIGDTWLQASTTLLLQFETLPQQSLALARRAKARGTRVMLNCAPARPLENGWLDCIDVLIANAGEAESVARDAGLPADPREFVQALSRRAGITAIVTLGSEGVVAATAEALYALPALEVDSVDTVGAGDAFVGVLAAMLDRGQSLSAAVAAATAAGSLACTRSGAQTSLPDEAAIAAASPLLQQRLSVTPRPQ